MQRLDLALALEQGYGRVGTHGRDDTRDAASPGGEIRGETLGDPPWSTDLASAMVVGR
jgi:hypothetical protein